MISVEMRAEKSDATYMVICYHTKLCVYCNVDNNIVVALLICVVNGGFGLTHHHFGCIEQQKMMKICWVNELIRLNARDADNFT